MTMRLVRSAAVILFAAATTAGCFGGGETPTACSGPADDDATAVVVSSGDVGAPNVVVGCIDSASDVDTITLTRPGGITGTFTVRCQAGADLVDFDTPVILDPGTACLPGNSAPYAFGSVTSMTVTVFAHPGSDGGEYRLELVAA